MMLDILWSDPVLDELNNQSVISSTAREVFNNNGQNIVVRFGGDRLKRFLGDNNLNFLIRSHECVTGGVEKYFNG